MNVAGVDPGLSGGIAVVNEHGTVVLVDDLPVHRVAKGKRVKAELDLASLRSLLTTQPLDHVVIEMVHAMPKQGVVSMYRFGYCTGSIVGMVAALQLPYSFVLPRVWQKACGVGPGPDDARRRATQLFPAVASLLNRKRDGGRADALLIAYWACRTLLKPAEAA